MQVKQQNYYLLHNLLIATILLPKTKHEPDVHYNDLRSYFTDIWIEGMYILSYKNTLNYNFILDRSYFSNLVYIGY